MGRAILSVVVGYVVMFAAIFLTFSGLYLLLGQDLSFRPGTYEPSVLWTVASFALGVVAAVLGGYVCAWIARRATPPKVLSGVVLVIGLLSAIPVLMAAATPAEARTGEVGNLDAMMKAKQPGWVAVVNPFVGLAGVLLGARLRRPTDVARCDDLQDDSPSGKDVADVERPLTTGEGGAYGALAARPIPPGLAVIFMPSLAALLAEAERIKGLPLTEEQVVRIRDKALVVVAPRDVVAVTVQQRGYAEVDAANPWESWQAIRSTDGSPLDR